MLRLPILPESTVILHRICPLYLEKACGTMSKSGEGRIRMESVVAWGFFILLPLYALCRLIRSAAKQGISDACKELEQQKEK